MKRETGDMNYPIWLIVNPKHPAIRHYIWTPILAVIQDKVFRELHTRIETENMYIRYAVKDSSIVPSTINWWGVEIAQEIKLLRKLVHEYRPKIIITFGSFAYEFMRRVYEIKPVKGVKFWGAMNLGFEFSRSIKNFDVHKTNIIPLLRRLIETNAFIDDNNYAKQKDDETENYFDYAGSKIAEKIVEYNYEFKIWIE